MIDVTDIGKGTDAGTDVKAGDEVVLFGEKNGRRIYVEDIASVTGTVNYEIVCLIGRRVPRVYIQNGQIVNVLNYLL
jgi:alanine racemase